MSTPDDLDLIAHYDVGLIEAAIPNLSESDVVEPTLFNAMCERVRTTSTISISEIAGRVGGGGETIGAERRDDERG